METKHTPGKWNIVESNKIDEEAHIQTDLKSICRMWIQMDSQDMANARLIAAAPDLLEALKALVADLKPYMGQGRMDDKIRNAIAAIAKAMGE